MWNILAKVHCFPNGQTWLGRSAEVIVPIDVALKQVMVSSFRKMATSQRNDSNTKSAKTHLGGKLSFHYFPGLSLNDIHDGLFRWRFLAMISSRTILTCALVCSIMSNLGCASFWHDLQPYRLQRLNRGPAPSLDPEFSQRTRANKTQLVKRTTPRKAPTLSANSAEIATVRAQNPER